MKIAYVTTYDASDVHAWSGIGNVLLHVLQGVSEQVSVIDKLADLEPTPMSRLKQAYYKRVRSQKFHLNREPSLLKGYAAQVKERLAPLDCDAVFSPGTAPIAYLKTDKPVAFYTDATFASMIDFYPWFTNVSASSIKQGNKMEQHALSNCHLAIYSSQWAADSAVRDYGVDPAKVKVVPFGANIACNREARDITELVERKTFDTCKLLLLGVDWNRKGGEKALAVAERLSKRGIKTELHVAGCETIPSDSPLIHNHGFISKKTDAGRAGLDKLLSESHFLILPSKAECFGIVFSEASSFGLPSLATNVGGIPSAVSEGKNGHLFDLEESPEKYCEHIERYMTSREQYREIALSSFAEYSERLNWDAAGKAIYRLMQTHCS